MTDIVPNNSLAFSCPKNCPRIHKFVLKITDQNHNIVLEIVNKIVTKVDNTFVNENMNAQNTYN